MLSVTMAELLHLHSTMLSIKWKTVDLLNEIVANLHSTMLSIKFSPRLWVNICNVIYIPLCYLLNGCQEKYSFFLLSTTDIYIPLCYLLNRGENKYDVIRTNIYIPLCYLLNCFEKSRWVCEKCIYIPLCYLLNYNVYIN